MSTTPTMPAETTVDTTQAFDLLGSDRRRALLRLLPADGTSMSIRTAALHLVLAESSEDAPTVAPETYRRALTSLHHAHLPKLADADAVDYDTESGSVRRGPVAAELEAYLP